MALPGAVEAPRKARSAFAYGVDENRFLRSYETSLDKDFFGRDVGARIGQTSSGVAFTASGSFS